MKEASDSYSIDKNRVYLTGLSLGGFDTWIFAQQHPELFAAIVPICGGGIPSKAWRIKDIPVWAFHGAKDDVVPVEETEKMVRALENIKGIVRCTIYPEANHGCWTEAYNEKELFNWLLAQKKK